MRAPRGLAREKSENSRYRLSFTACSLRLPHWAILLELYRDCRDWQKNRQIALDENLVQARTLSSRKRMSYELVMRLKHLHDEQVDLFLQSGHNERLCLLWLGICRCYGFIGDFVREVVRENYLSDKIFATLADYKVFFHYQAQWHTELERLSDSTRYKMGQNLFLLMRETAIIGQGNEILPTCAPASFLAYLANLGGGESLFFPGLAWTR